MQTEELLAQASVIPVLEVEDLAYAAPLARALADGGMRVVELTLRTACAIEAVAEMKAAAPELIIGMGTVRGPADVERSLAAGVSFLVTPGSTPTTLKAMADAGAIALPGAASATEALIAQEHGFNALKFFPAEQSGGAAWLKSIAGPMPDIKWCPTGGVSLDKIETYMALPNVACVGGTWIARKPDIKEGNWAVITENARKAMSFKD